MKKNNNNNNNNNMGNKLIDTSLMISYTTPITCGFWRPIEVEIGFIEDDIKLWEYSVFEMDVVDDIVM